MLVCKLRLKINRLSMVQTYGDTVYLDIFRMAPKMGPWPLRVKKDVLYFALFLIIL